jgi:HlyD family secretion protein
MKLPNSQINSVQNVQGDVEQLSLFPIEDEPTRITSPSKRFWGWLFVIGLSAVAGVGGWHFVATLGKRNPAATAQGAKGPPPRPVEVAPLRVGRANTQVRLIGQVEASQQATIRAQTGGVLKTMMVNVGDRITTGEVIAQLEDTDQSLSIAQSRAQLAQQRSNLARLEQGTRPEILAQRRAAVQAIRAQEQDAADNLKRSQDLVRQGALAQRELITARTELDNLRNQRLEAEAELAEATAGPIQAEIDAQKANVAAAVASFNQSKLAQNRTRIVAATSGIVRAKQANIGDFIEAGGEIVSVVADNKLDIFLDVPESLGSQVQPGKPVQLMARAFPEWKQNATITALAPTADAASRRQRVRVTLNNPTARLLPGMAVEALLVKPATRSGASYVVSRDILTQRGEKWFVATIAKNKAKLIPVKLTADMGSEVAIASPLLRAGQILAVRGVDGLRDGMTVKVVGN